MSSDPAPGTTAEAPVPARARTTRSGAQRIAHAFGWTARFVLALFLFVGALQVMKTGAGNLSILQGEGWLVRNAGSTFGLGWVGALFVLSGSPIAASALTLVAAGSITETEGFTMLTGSRLGAAFVVLLVAVVYALRGGEGKRMAPVSTAVMALSTTALVYAPGAVIGYALLRWEPFRAVDVTFPAQFTDLIDVVYGGMLARIETWNAGLLFVGGLGILLLAFKLIDTVVPEMSQESIESSRLGWLRKKWPMFGLGCLVALVTMSVSVALTVLVPLVAKGYVKREDIVPYIMGANITTLGDTLLAGLALHSPGAVRIVVAQVISTTILSVLVLWLRYWETRKVIWRFQNWVVKPGAHVRMAAFTASLFAVPLALILIGGLAG
ncbi:MAG TPA: hypothetical protein VHJ34_00735 [Actinomycetota bacterium]|nr:hypothetical protein [Actinomycetota bacterium]